MFANLTLRDRTLLGYSVPTLLILIFSGGVYIAASETKKTFRQVEIAQNNIILADDLSLSFSTMDRRMRGYLLETDPERLQRFAKDRQEFIELQEKLQKSPQSAAQKPRLERFQRHLGEMTKLVEATTQAAQKNKTQAVANYLIESNRILDDFFAVNQDYNRTEQEILAQSMSTATGSLQFLSVMAIVTSVGCVAIAILVTHLTARFLGEGVNKVVQVADQIAQGNLRQSIEGRDVLGRNEISQLMQTFKAMTEQLHGLIYQVQRSGIDVTTSTTQIAASGKQLEATLAEQTASTNETVAAAKQIAATSKELLHTMEEVAMSSQETASTTTASQQDLVRMAATMQQLKDATTAIATRLGLISEKANNINSIVVTITKVADQTNLLSLNAAIEAEKAGEYGLGFAVVAREIRRLADQTAVATLDIEQMVKEMQSSVSTGVMEMDKFATEVGRSVEDVANLSQQVATIISQVQNLTPRFSMVSQSMEAQSLGAQQISESMLQLSATSMQSTDSLREINRAIVQLNEVAQKLRQEISRFQLRTETV